MASYFRMVEKNAHVKKLENEVKVADSLEVRMELIKKMHAGELSLQEVQDQLKQIKKQAGKLGQITRAKAYSQG